MNTTEEDVQKALNRSYFYLQFRPRTEHEVRVWLEKKSEKFYHWKVGIIDKAIEKLKEYNYVNDRDFIESFVKTRTAIKPKSEFALRQDLMKAGISKDLLDEFFSENKLPEEELAKEAIRVRWNRYKYMDKKDRFQKAAQFLMRRGFSFSIAKQTIEEMDTAS